MQPWLERLFWPFISNPYIPSRKTEWDKCFSHLHQIYIIDVYMHSLVGAHWSVSFFIIQISLEIRERIFFTENTWNLGDGFFYLLSFLMGFEISTTLSTTWLPEPELTELAYFFFFFEIMGFGRNLPVLRWDTYQGEHQSWNQVAWEGLEPWISPVQVGTRNFWCQKTWDVF